MWLNEIKKEVEEKGLLSCLAEGEEEEIENGLPEVLTTQSLGIITGAQKTPVGKKIKSALMKSRRNDAANKKLARKNRTVIYDRDFDFDAGV